MTTIVKAGGSSLDTREKIERVLQQADELDDDIILVVSAQGKITDRIVKALADPGEMPAWKDVYTEFEGLDINNYLNGFVKSIQLGYEGLRARPPSENEKAAAHLSGERLTAYAVNHIACNMGIDSGYVDFTSNNFPLVVKGDALNAVIKFDASREKAGNFDRKTRISILPGYGGITLPAHKMRTLGRGGSDTAAFAYLYIFDADRLLILTDVPGIKTGNVREGRTVPELSIDEAEAAASLGAKLPGIRSLEGLRLCYEEGREPEVSVTYSQDMNGEATRIVRGPVSGGIKLVAGRKVYRWKVEGDAKGIFDALSSRGLEPIPRGSIYKPSFLVPEEYEEHAELVFSEYEDAMRHKGARTRIKRPSEIKNGNLGYVGIVGTDIGTGMTKRTAGALESSGINIEYNHDPDSENAIGHLVKPADLYPAIQSLHREFFG